MLAILTVGSTEFTELTQSFLSTQSLQALQSKGITSILAQIGNSTLLPDWSIGSTRRFELNIEIVKFLSDIENRIATATIVISHAGAGSILSVMRPNIKEKAGRIQLLVVPNTTLMDSHQQDIAQELQENNWARVSTPENLASTISILNLSLLDSDSPYPPFNPLLLPNILDTECGFA